MVVPVRGDESGDSPDLWFPVGETLVFRVYWGAFPIAISTATTAWEEYEGQRVIAIRFKTQSNKVIGKLYPVDDVIECLVAPEGFRPLRFRKRLKEGRYRCDEETVFDYETGMARWQSFTKDRHKEYPLSEGVRDLVSFMYFIRGEPRHFVPGEVVKHLIMADEKIYEAYVKPVAIEKVKLPDYGRVESVRFEPEAKFEGLFVKKGKLWVWVSNDERRTLTKVQARVPIASVKIYLAAVKGPGDDFWTQHGTKDFDGN
jgi:hypothetical protein